MRAGALLRAAQRLRGFAASHALLLLFGSVSAVVLAASTYNYVAISFFMRASEHNLRARLRETGTRLAAMVTVEELDAYRGPADMELPGYKALRLRLAEFASGADVLYAYYLRGMGDEMQYIVDNDFDEETRVGLDTPPTKSVDTPGLPAALEGRVGVSGLGAYMPGWDGLRSAYVPMLDRSGAVAAVAGVDIRDAEMLTMRKRGRWALILEIASAALVAAGGAYGFAKYRREARIAQSADAAKGRFLSRISHDIRTPMNAVMGMSDLALMDYGTPKGMEHIADIKRTGGFLLELINELLDFAALDSGAPRIRETPYRMAPALSDTLSIIRARLRDNPAVELTLNIDPHIPSALVGDERRVKEVLLNLLSNAVKYTPAGFIRLAAAARREEGGRVLLAFDVSDSGIGIRQEDLGALFVDFSRAGDERVSKIQGTGLGLSITRTICRAMGGDVAVESRYGEGSTFTATIRQGVSDEAPMGEFAEFAEPSCPRPADFAAPGFRVLIVDDSVTNLKVAEGLLAPYRVQADTCTSGAEAIDLVQRNEYGLVLMDCLMPGMDGAEAAAAIRALGGAFERLPIAALTADAAEGARERLIGQGFDDFLSKPIGASELRGLLGRWASAPKDTAPQGDAALGDFAGTGARGIAGLDAAKGVANAGGARRYMDLLETYCREARGRMDALRTGDGEADLKDFVTNVHALKSASANIGAAEISVAAALLEAAGLRGDAAYIGESAARFRDGLAALVERIEGALAAAAAVTAEVGADAAGAAGSGAGRADAAKTSVDPAGAEAAALAKLAALQDALEAEDVDLADRLMEEISAAAPGALGAPGALDIGTRELLARVAELALTSDFQEAARTVAGFIGRQTGQ